MSKFLSQKPSLFIGRWQPFHEGHKKLLETVLKKGKPVVIAIRDTEIDQKNPYTTSERWTLIQRALVKYGELVKIIVIPDIDEVCYGRDVGYGIRKIDLDNKSQSISGTKVRENSKASNVIIWLTGQSGSGKTTLAEELAAKINAVTLDGDEMRKSISIEAGFSPKDRNEHNIRVARLAMVLSRRSPVVVSVIAPFKKTRTKIDEIAQPIWVYLKREIPKDKNRPYEEPDKPHVSIEITDKTKPENSAELIINYLRDSNRL